MSKFKVGDAVVRVEGSWRGAVEGAAYYVESVTPDGHLLLRGCSGVYHENHFRLVGDTSKHHKHHDLIIAWAKGAEIEFFSQIRKCWKDCPEPLWCSDAIYRIKPENPNADEIASIESEMRKLADRLEKLKENS